MNAFKTLGMYLPYEWGMTANILETHYKSLPISASMKRFFSAHGIADLDGLLKIKTKDLLAMKGFNERLLYELTCVLDENNILNRLK